MLFKVVEASSVVNVILHSPLCQKLVIPQMPWTIKVSNTFLLTLGVLGECFKVKYFQK